MADIQSTAAEIRRGKKDRRKKKEGRKKLQGKNIMAPLLHRAAIRRRRRRKKKELECGPMPNVMVALPNMGGALCSTPQTLDDAHY